MLTPAFHPPQAAVRAPPPMPKPAMLPMTISAALVNTTNIPDAVPNTTAPVTAATSAASSVAPLVASAAAAAMLAALLL